MKSIAFIILPIAMMTACSDPNLSDLDEGELKDIERQVEEGAKSLTDAADEAVKVLEEEVQAELDEDGIGANTESPAPASKEESGEQ